MRNVALAAAIAAAAAAGSTLPALHAQNAAKDYVGVVTATSSNPDFAAAMAADPNVDDVGEDPMIQWLPNERVVDAGITAASLPPANAETRSPLQWNLRVIHADQTAANGDRGNGAVRARVAVLDSGIVTDHIDIQQNLNLALSKS